MCPKNNKAFCKKCQFSRKEELTLQHNGSESQK